MTAFWSASDGLGALETQALAGAPRVPAADVALVASLLVFLCASYMYCICSRHMKRDRRRTKRAPAARERAIFVKDMEEPLLGPPEYEQPPALELSPPAYEYLPSAPPLSWDHEHGLPSP